MLLRGWHVRRTTNRRDERNKALLWFRCGNPGTVTYLSRRIPRTSIYGFNLPHLRAISTLFPRVVRSEFRRSLARPHAMHILSRDTFPLRARCVQSIRAHIYTFLGDRAFPKAMYIPRVSGTARPDTIDHAFTPFFHHFLTAANADCSVSLGEVVSSRTSICTMSISAPYALIPRYSFGTGNNPS